MLTCWQYFSPYRITDDCGGAFTMGCLGGAVFSAIKGFRLAPPVSWYASTLQTLSVLIIDNIRVAVSYVFCFYRKNLGEINPRPNSQNIYLIRLMLQGIKSRLTGMTTSVKVKAPVLGGL